MDPQRSPARWAPLVAALAALAVGLWLVRGGTQDPPEATLPAAAAAPEAPRSPPPAPSLDLVEPSHRIGESGRLSLEASALPEEGMLSLGLELPDEARGSEPRPVVIASEDGRRLETSAAIPAESGSGVRLEIDPRFLRPGRYMVSVTTVEPKHFPVRRYVIEIR